MHSLELTATEIPKFVSNSAEEVYAKKFENLGEVDMLLETRNFPNLSEAAAGSRKGAITMEESEGGTRRAQERKSPGQDVFTQGISRVSEEELPLVLHRAFSKIQQRNTTRLSMPLASSESLNA